MSETWGNVVLPVKYPFKPFQRMNKFCSFTCCAFDSSFYLQDSYKTTSSACVFCLFSFQIFPDPSDFERCCKLKDRLPSIVVEATEEEVESGELRWPPEEFLVSEEEDEEHDEKVQNGQMHDNWNDVSFKHIRIYTYFFTRPQMGLIKSCRTIKISNWNEKF